MTKSIAVIGEAVADAVAEPSATDGALRLEVRPGGGPANTAVALARLGSPTRFFGRLSGGVLGQLLRTHLEKSMVDLSGSVTERREATLAIAAIDDSGGAAYDFYIDGTADWQWNEDELAAAATSSVVHTGSLALVLSPGAEAITATLRKARPRATVSIDPNVRPAIASAERYRRGLDAWASLADILKLSQDDLDFTHPDTDARRLCERWHTLGCRLIVITRGAHGAVASLDGEWVKVAARRVHVADTIGAGDAFTAGLLHRLTVRGHHGGRLDRLDLATLTDALELAALVAARCCEVPGADPPWIGQLGPGH
ncbi:carbohydrate kinase family protein [Stackebrandtia nassauensis]|uniref:PfkB domain protein n=1 Tax=Stackebrandtia nassauensis (strain DSM 44728 / CIP 108903 / NRRL B-16338 / NBRC 102104 / LLR-40K-21) TaxID=446470 RepID=D3QB58_STANL|nr:carbohydrate kinase [Stackebrandtia nassauensis]ADD40875.1 PfkB domain protein [Stackebrandtia nassauensis DSM 44728]